MKALRLEIEGFGPYLARQTVDFRAFDAEGLFVISGKTGAGKSTILDAITFALYGDVPRYTGTEKSIRSHFCGEEDPTEVVLDFEVGTETYRIRRSPDYERVKQRGEGTTVQPAEAQLWVRRGDDWEALAMKPREAGQEIARIMQLTPEQFLQVILLAQGRFAEFLQAGTDSRLRLLRSLFGTQRFEELTAHLRDIARQRARALEAADAELEVLVSGAVAVAAAASPEEIAAPAPAEREAWFAATVESLTGLAARLAGAATSAAEGADAAKSTLTEARGVEAQRRRLTDARDKVGALEARSEVHAEDRSRLDRARRAAPVSSAMEASQGAEARLASATERRDAALVSLRSAEVAGLAWPAASGDLSQASVEALRARTSELASERGSLAEALEAEGRLASLEQAREQAEGGLEAAQEARSHAQEQLAALPAREQALRTELDGATAAAARLADLEDAVAREEKAATAHERIDAAQATLQAAREQEATASARRLGAVDRHDALLRLRLKSQAAVLAGALEEGKPCAVCGSTSHPYPAQPTDAHVTDEAVEEARAFADRIVKEFEEFQDRAAAAATALEVAQAEAGGRSREEVTAALTAAVEARDGAKAAAGRKSALESELEALGAERERLGRLIEERGAAVEAAQARATQAAAAVAAAGETIARGRGEHASVAARAAALESARGLVDAVAGASEALGSSRASAEEARGAVERAAAATGLGDLEAVRAALLPRPEMDALAARIEQHEADLSGARAVVAELESVPLPEEVADLVALEAAAAEADAGAKEAARASSDAASAVGQFTRLAENHAVKAASTAEARERHQAVDTLANTLEGKEPNERRMRLESFVLAARLEEIVAAANARLTTMSSGQYLLEYDDSAQFRNKQTGLELTIADAHTGRSRSTRSLSGGETFLASLALALGLAETVTSAAGGIQLDTIFIDEGFGSLDEDTLEVAMSTLDDLRDAGRTVGLISHVETMKEAIPAKLEVVKSGDGSSSVAVVLGDG
ncbi:AAA family ATPase [Demequina sp. SYSU T00039]|uniref:Nuclease SbcCD subunit C n=1 Tax=Demequina lignilytica TaxID=3051663 RepID=A0AAW7M328_9MICO|nr:MULTISPECIES: AAA family ATPase [unclassified Demequina]MDN4477277.1 AAA family ATPase [Demequina sp. SYSU T00039-1]MDN4487450.1 AAA family ATPase [Demequina sp. SYSU T00039]